MPHNFRAPRLALAVLVLLTCIPSPAPASAAQADGERITTATNVRLRNEPDTTGTDELGRLPLGVVVKVLERSDGKQKVGEREDYWYLVSAPDGTKGWVFGALTSPFAPARREEIYRKLASDRLANSSATFAELVDLVRFAERAAKEVRQREALADIELARVHALARSLASIGFEDLQKEPFQTWAKEREQEIVYSEPAGQWYVNSDLYWSLQQKYKDLPAGELAAWSGAENPLPGECEGYLPCYLAAELMTKGKYLKLYPRGPHAREAFDSVAELLEAVAEDLKQPQPVYDVPREDRKDFQAAVAELRALITSVTHPKRDRALAQLDAIARRFR
ncbi:MAG TPA: SH3 domain-containing protein [Pyrinomonadaceae bacterium]|nr:SH3 domain-containing protein [Pyrinomonadaceae bacterium]